MQKIFLAFSLFFLVPILLSAQSLELYINEFVADNTTGLQDEDYEFPDWLELYNGSADSIDLTGYSLTDDPLNTTKWIIPSIILPPDHFLVVFASGKDRYNLPVTWSTVIDWGEDWKYLVPDANTPTDWHSTSFSDVDWNLGKSGFGYGDDDDATILPSGTMSVFVRKTFPLSDLASIKRCLLHMDYDDGFIAYLNGVEIARANLGIPGTSVAFDSPTSTDHEAKIYTGGRPEKFEVNQIQELLVEGENILAIEIHNAGAGSSDLSAIPFLSFGYNFYDGTPVTSELLDLPSSSLHTNFKLDRSGEFLGLYKPDGFPVDSLTFGSQKTNVAHGRSSSDPSLWGFLAETTPGTTNGLISTQFSPEPEFSLTGGFYTGQQQVTLITGSPTAAIYYSLDGKVPGENSNLYTGPITLDSTTALRAIVMEDGKISSEVITRTYFIDEEVNLPFISIVTDPDHLFSDQSGIYVTGTNGIPGSCDQTVRNLNRDWERPVNLELYETSGVLALNQGAGIKIFGGCSRTRYPQKSFALYARSEYGKGSFEYQFFPDKDIHEFESVILRSSADDQTRTMIKDAFAHYVQVEYMDIDYMAYRPAVVFINGAYWGIHNIREKINEHYLAENHDVDPDDVNILQSNASVVYGNAYDYQQMMDFVTNNPITEAANYHAVLNMMDVDQYIDYQIANIYLAEVDWPGNNIKFWNTNSQDHHRWRWITFDRDQTFLPYRIETNSLGLATAPNGTGWPNPAWSTLLFRRLLTNDIFRNTFIQLYAYHMNTTFEAQRISGFVDTFKVRIENEIPRHIQRWGGQVDPDMNESWTAPPTFNSVAEWEYNLNDIKRFALERPSYAITHMTTQFGLHSLSEVTIQLNNDDAGKVKIYHAALPYGGYSGQHFNEIPIKLRAIPLPDFTFSHWTISSSAGQETKENPVIDIIPEGPLSIVAHFELVTTPDEPRIVINEINYNSHSDMNSGDWVELYNRSGDIIDLSGWSIKDEQEDHIFTIPNGTEMAPDNYLVICENVDDFRNIYPGVYNRIGNMDFKFSNDGEVIRLFDFEGLLVDSVHYDDRNPWPETADGSGPTLELLDPNLNNDLAENWEASLDIGSPGRKNHTVTGITEFENQVNDDLFLYQNYPNPASSSTVISYSLQKSGMVQLLIHDMMGREVKSLVNQIQQAAEYSITFDTKDLANGIYLYSLQHENDFAESRRMIVHH